LYSWARRTGTTFTIRPPKDVYSFPPIPFLPVGLPPTGAFLSCELRTANMATIRLYPKCLSSVHITVIRRSSRCGTIMEQMANATRAHKCILLLLFPCVTLAWLSLPTRVSFCVPCSDVRHKPALPAACRSATIPLLSHFAKGKAMPDEPYRILSHHAGQLPAVSLMVDGKPVPARAGEPLAATLLAQGLRVCRTTLHDGTARGVFCAIGVCGDCAMQVNGVPGVRACVTPVEDGMRVETQHGSGAWQFALDNTGHAR